MIRVAVYGLRGHPAALLGTFVSITLAVLLVTVTLSCAIAAQHPAVAVADPELADLATALLANAAAVAMLAATFVASSTLAYSAAQRQGELALLRLGGASAGRVGAVLLLEALVVGLLAAGLGVALGLPGARLFAGLLDEARLAPAGLPDAVAAWPAGIAAGVGIAATLIGAVPVTIRNARIPPFAALREAVAPALRMTAPRWIIAVLLAVGACAELPLLRGAGGGTISAYLVLFTITLIPLFAVCSPAIVRGILIVLTLAFRRGPALVAVTAAGIDLRRIAATTTPILITLALGAAILSSSATVTATVSDSASDPDTSADTIAVLSVVGLTLTYTAISIAVTFAMSTANRRRELAATRLAGAARAQTLGMVALDVLFVIIIAVIQAAAITALVVLVAAWSLSEHVLVLDLPTGTVAAILAVCVVLGTTAALLSARAALTAR